MKHAAALILLAAAFGLSCAERALTREAARERIEAIDGFKRVAHFWVRTGVPFRTTFECLDQAEVAGDPLNQLLVKLGWVRYETRPTIVGIRKTVDCPVMALTSVGESASSN